MKKALQTLLLSLLLFTPLIHAEETESEIDKLDPNVDNGLNSQGMNVWLTNDFAFSIDSRYGHSLDLEEQYDKEMIPAFGLKFRF